MTIRCSRASRACSSGKGCASPSGKGRRSPRSASGRLGRIDQQAQDEGADGAQQRGPPDLFGLPGEHLPRLVRLVDQARSTHLGQQHAAQVIHRLPGELARVGRPGD
jgi:hypothetical protein